MDAQTQIKLSPNQAAALTADITEINHLQQVLELRSGLLIRHRDALVKDASLDPERIQSYEIKEVGGEHFLIVTAKQES